jgi:hypothetical protein
MADNLTAATNGPPQMSATDFAALKAELVLATVAKDTAVAKVRAIRARMEKAGCDMKALDLHLRLSKVEDAVAELYLRNAGRYNAWAGKPIGSQGALFGSDDAPGPSEKAAEELRGAVAYEAGYVAAQGGQTQDDCPYEAGSFFAQRWSQGFVAGRAVLDEISAGKPPKASKTGSRKPGRRAARAERAQA